jgi:hypothetical protein
MLGVLKFHEVEIRLEIGHHRVADEGWPYPIQDRTTRFFNLLEKPLQPGIHLIVGPKRQIHAARLRLRAGCN